MTPADVIARIESLSQGQKYNLLQSHYNPSSDYTFPSVHMNGCNRSFSPHWLKRYSWLVYSPKLDGVFCIYCALFGKQRYLKGALVNAPFTRWTKLSECLKAHATGSHHCDAHNAGRTFCESLEQPEVTLPYILDEQRKQRMSDNRHILALICKAVLHCGRQCQALRGRIEHVGDVSHNPGNFLATLKLLSESEPLLKKHLESPKLKNAHYMSPASQNEVISIIGDIIQSSIVNEIREAKFYTITADEVTSHNKEQMPFCVRFVDMKRQIREEFIEFIPLARTTGVCIGQAIVATLNKLSLPLENIRGQGYDGAASMSGSKSGVQAYIKKLSPLAVYTHCAGHCLNLVIVHTCKIVSVRNMMDKLKETCLFFNYSPKKENLLKEIITKDVPEAAKRKPLLNLCTTRWAERQEAYRHFYQAYVHIVTCLELIAHGLHRDKGYDPLFTDGSWDCASKSRASSLLSSLTGFDFIITFVCVYMILSRLEGITVQLQQKAIDIFDAYKKVN